jgi:ATP-dependent DNA ligase
MRLIPPMLATRLEDARRLTDPRYIAEPKLDGQRAQVHDHRTIHVFSRPGRELIRLPGLAWLREIRWPMASAIFDGEVVAGRWQRGHPSRL